MGPTISEAWRENPGGRGAERLTQGNFGFTDEKGTPRDPSNEPRSRDLACTMREGGRGDGLRLDSGTVTFRVKKKN